jgi:exonuclease III
MKILSWNVNGIRAATKKGLFEWIKKELPDIFCLQEIKAMPDQVPFTFHDNIFIISHNYLISIRQSIHF